MKSGLSLPFDVFKQVNRIIGQIKDWQINPKLKAYLEDNISKQMPPDIKYNFVIDNNTSHYHLFHNQKSDKFLKIYHFD